MDALMEVLSMDVGDHFPARYRIKFQGKIRYLHIELGIWERDRLSIPPLLIPRLPTFPSGDWNTLNISQDPTGEIKLTPSTQKLPAITECICAPLFDALSIERVNYMRARLYEVRVPGLGLCVSKIARFDDEIEYAQVELCAYHAVLNSTASDIVPKVVGHLHEDGRVMGLLLEKLEGRPAGIEDLEECRQVLQRLHKEADVVHNDVNRYNFVVTKGPEGQKVVKIIDLELADWWTEAGGQKDLDSLEGALKDTSGLGSTVTVSPKIINLDP